MTTVQWIDREAWGAAPLPRLGHVVPHEQFIGLAVHHTVTVVADVDRDGFIDGDLDDIATHMRHLQTVRPDLGADVPYSFVVFPAGTDDSAVVCEGRGWGRTGAHTAGHNSTRYGVAFAGDYTDRAPTPGMVAAVRWLGSLLADPAGAAITLGHRQTYPTACPGEAAYPLLVHMQPPFGTETPAPQEDPDMQLTDQTTAGHTVNDVLLWTLQRANESATKLDVALARISALEANLANPIGAVTGPVNEDRIAELVAAKLAARLAS
jgi:hypothetical protein